METAYPLVFLVALAYAAVGHGGASGYLAVLGLLGFAPSELAAGALALNVLVSGLAFAAYWRAGHLVPSLLWPFALASVPAAFIGGLATVPAWLYSRLLAAALLFAALRVFIAAAPEDAPRLAPPPGLRLTLPVGGLIGLLSGIVGVGGGIFLSPLLILSRWASLKQAAAASAGFILLNSLAGLYGHASRRPLELAGLWPLVLAAGAGGLIGSHLGARRLGDAALRRALALVLVAAAVKFVMRGA